MSFFFCFSSVFRDSIVHICTLLQLHRKTFCRTNRIFMFQNASFVSLLEILLSPIRALCLLTLCVGLDVVWEFRWIIFLQKSHWYCFYTTLNRVVRFSLLSCFSWSFLSIFLHGRDVYTMRYQMQNLQLLPLMRFSFRDVSETTSNYKALLIHRVLYTSNVIFERFWNLVF